MTPPTKKCKKYLAGMRPHSCNSIYNDFNTLATMNKRVQFSFVEVREYDVTLGVHPCCSEGPALSLDSTFQNYYRMPVNMSKNQLSRRPLLRKTSGVHRTKLLLSQGFTACELNLAESIQRRILNEREDTIRILKCRKQMKMMMNHMAQLRRMKLHAARHTRSFDV